MNWRIPPSSRPVANPNHTAIANGPGDRDSNSFFSLFKSMLDNYRGQRRWAQAASHRAMSTSRDPHMRLIPASAVDLRLRNWPICWAALDLLLVGQLTNFVPIQIQRIWRQFSAFQLAECIFDCKIWRAYAAPVTNQDENG